MISVLILLATIIATSSIISNLFVSYVRNIQHSEIESQALEASEAVRNDVLFRFGNGNQVGPSETYQIGSSTVVVEVNEVGSLKNVASTASLGGYTYTTNAVFGK